MTASPKKSAYLHTPGAVRVRGAALTVLGVLEGEDLIGDVRLDIDRARKSTDLSINEPLDSSNELRLGGCLKRGSRVTHALLVPNLDQL